MKARSDTEMSRNFGSKMMISRDFFVCCPQCGTNYCSLVKREYLITTTSFRKISHTTLVETVTCDECGSTWSDHYEFLNGRRGDWIFSFPILKCPICGGDNFEVECHGRGGRSGQCLQFRCIDNDDFVWREEYAFLHAEVLDKEEERLG